MNHNEEIFYGSSCNDVPFNDYLLLGGGSDISPSLYGEPDNGLSQYPDKRRDERNMAAIDRYVRRGLPIFGICRGLQIMDAAFGGKLIQHTVGHRSLVPVVVEGKRNNEIEGIGRTTIDNCRSCHHQVVDLKYTKGNVIGWSEYEFQAFRGLEIPNDVETLNIVPQIIYWPEKRALAVQFHPEWQGESHEMNKHLRGLIKQLLGLENVL